MKNIVVYESKYGSTERYSKWVGGRIKLQSSKIKRDRY